MSLTAFSALGARWSSGAVSSGFIVNTGSKQGITSPPGNTAYNVSKAAVKALTEGLAHTLRNLPGCQIARIF